MRGRRATSERPRGNQRQTHTTPAHPAHAWCTPREPPAETGERARPTHTECTTRTGRNGRTISLSPSRPRYIGPLSALAARAIIRAAPPRVPAGPRTARPRIPSSSFGRPSRRAAADPPAPSRERVRVGPSAPFQRTLWGLDPSPASPVTLTHDQRGTGVQARGHSSVRAANRGTRDLAPRACLFGAPQTPHSIPIRDLPSGSCPTGATRLGSAASLTGPDPQAPATRPAPGRAAPARNRYCVELLTTTGSSDREPDPRQGKASKAGAGQSKARARRLSRGRPAHAAGGQARMPYARSFIGWPITRPNLPPLPAECAAPISMAARARDP